MRVETNQSQPVNFSFTPAAQSPRSFSSSLSTCREDKKGSWMESVQRIFSSIWSFLKMVFCCGCYRKKEAPPIPSSPGAPVPYVKREEAGQTVFEVEHEDLSWSIVLVREEEEGPPVMGVQHDLPSAIEAAVAASIVRHEAIEEVKVSDFVLAKALVDEGFEIDGDIIVDSFGGDSFKTFVTSQIVFAEKRREEMSETQKKALEKLIEIKDTGFKDPALTGSTCLVASYPLALFLKVITSEDAEEARRCQYTLREATFSLPENKQLD
ncbi:MAG: hypothetical protein KR126chlam1_00574 [Chlamydiae bacterium]|nr:hypothetical protein [Chlamydiota bacterium]